MSVLVVIPARGGSLGVNRKAMQLVGGEPLVVRAARWATRAGFATVVTTENKEIAATCRLRGYEVHDRPAGLSGDSIPLSEVLAAVARAYPKFKTYLLLQPTVPLVTDLDLKDLVEGFHASGLDAAYAAVPDPHQFWQGGRRVTPLVNRQILAADYEKCLYRETGLRIVNRQYALDGSGRAGVVELDRPELGIDVDSYDDLLRVERELGMKHVALRCVANPIVGTGHLFRCLRLADALRRQHHVTLEVLDYKADWITKLLDSRNLHGTIAPGRSPDLLVLDALDHYDSQIIGALQYETPTVVLESESKVALQHATLVINELIPQPVVPQPHVLYGPSYAVLREEFVGLPFRKYNPCLKRVAVSFGGSDPANLAQRAANLQVLRDPDIEVRVIQGPAAQNVPKLRENAKLIRDANVAEEFYHADLVLTSQGRTQYEAAACGAPTITMAANEREARHERCPGHLHLGLHAKVTGAQLGEAVARVVSTAGLREEMGTTAKLAVDGRGVERIVWAIDGILRGL